MDLTMLMYLVLFLIILGLFLASLLRRKIDKSRRNGHPTLPGRAFAAPQEELGDKGE